MNNLPISTTVAETAKKQLEEDYCCMQCDAKHPLDEFDDLESDGDIWGICPSCGAHSMIVQFDDEEGILDD